MANNIKQLREQREFETIFNNPKSARTMWAKNVFERYSKPAFEPIIVTDKDGNISPATQVELAIWKQIKNELELSGSDRLPTEGEMIEACQAYYSRHNASSYTARRDSMGAKPVDESKQAHTVNNPFDDFTDEELLIMQEALAAARASSAQSLASSGVSDASSAQSLASSGVSDARTNASDSIVPDLSKYIEIERRD